MSESGQSAERIRTGLQTFASWIGLRRPDDYARGEDLLADPEPDSVVFTSQSPLTAAYDSGRLSSVLTESWIKRHCEPFLYENAGILVRSSNVVLTSAGKDRIIGKVCDGEVFSVEIWFENNSIAASCQCENYRRHVAAAISGDPRLACAHIVALARYLVSSVQAPQSSIGERAFICPITRLPLNTGRLIYRCEKCKLSFSEEGWLFLKEMDRGRCCGCQARGSIHVLVTDREQPHAGSNT